MKRFLETLPLSSSEKRALNVLDVENAFEVVSLSKAAPEAFQKVIAPTLTEDLVKRISPYLTADEVKLINQDAPSFALGAKLGAPPMIKLADQSQRDALFLEYQSLDQIPNPDPEIVAQKKALRERIEKLLSR